MASVRSKINNAEKRIDQAKLKIKDALKLFDPVIIYPYRGYGTGKKFFIDGRILERERMIHGDEEYSNTIWNNLRKIWKRYESDEIPGVGIEAEIQGIKAKTFSNDEGFFKLIFKVPSDKILPDGWHEVNLKICHMPFDLKFEKTAVASVCICNQKNSFGIVSDVDDTIIKSSAMNTLKKLHIMLTLNARNRASFPGVETLYQRLNNNSKNPLFFVSGSSWNLYDMLIEFCQHQNIPKAPFFLRNLGLNPKQWIKQDTSPYKKEHIIHILNVFSHMSFILIGDSGQEDPEIYTEIYKEYPRQVKSIYIRHLQNDSRKKELEQMAKSLDVPFLLINDSNHAIEHAVSMNWI